MNPSDEKGYQGAKIGIYEYPLYWLVTTLLTYYIIQSRGADAERDLYEDGELGITYLADLSEFALFSGNN